MVKVKYWTERIITKDELLILHKERCEQSNIRKYANDHNMWFPHLREQMVAICEWQTLTWEINSGKIVIKD